MVTNVTHAQGDSLLSLSGCTVTIQRRFQNGKFCADGYMDVSVPATTNEGVSSPAQHIQVYLPIPYARLMRQAFEEYIDATEKDLPHTRLEPPEKGTGRHLFNSDGTFLIFEETDRDLHDQYTADLAALYKKYYKRLRFRNGIWASNQRKYVVMREELNAQDSHVMENLHGQD